MLWATEQSRWVRYPFIGFGLLILFVLFPVMLYHGWQAYQTSQNCPNWPTTLGQVSHFSEMKEQRKGVTFYTVFVNYSYQVDGRRFKGSRVSPRNGWSQAERDRIVNTYTPGSQSAVAYNPADPSDSFLEPTPQPGAFLSVVFPFAAIPFSLLLFSLAWVLRKKRHVDDDYVPKRHRRGRGG
jgi:Protein of unknown function (DUF3592)